MITLPGFTAERSLYKKGRSYGGIAQRHPMGNAVQPADRVITIECTVHEICIPILACNDDGCWIDYYDCIDWVECQVPDDVISTGSEALQ